jgi:glycosyltransferase involved in cell wall biosynthesis
LLLGSRRGLPTFCWQHAAYLKTGNRLLLRAMQSRARLWLADSECVTALTAQRLHVEPGRLLTWPIFAADPNAQVAPAWRPGETLQLGSLGRLHRVKGYDVLIAALALLRQRGFREPVPYRLTIAGDGTQRAALQEQARAAGLAVHLPGFADKPQQFLAGLHLYLQPSRSEGFCIAAHEAMVAGLPVLASAVGEMPHTMQDGLTGRVVPPADPSALADALQALLSQPERLHEMGMAARARVLERCSPQRFTAAGAELFRRMAAASAADRTTSPARSDPPV